MKTSSTTRAMALLSLLFFSATASPVENSNIATRQGPVRRGGFTANCDFYTVTNHGEAYSHLQAQCNMDPGNPATEVATTLDLSLCLGNYNDNLDWGYMYVFRIPFFPLSALDLLFFVLCHSCTNTY